MTIIDSDHPLYIDPQQQITELSSWLQDIVNRKFRRGGVIVALSGGIDSSVTAALCVEALGKDHVFGLLMPEKDNSAETRKLSRLIADHLEIDSLEEDITGMLKQSGCYQAQTDAVRSVIPDFKDHWKFKIVLPGLLESAALRLFSVIVRDDTGHEHNARLTREAYLHMVAATNFKQRIRKMREYFHADRLNYLVTGTPNRLEYELGFFVKLGDGAADLKPIAHLYKTQVYLLAEFLGLPEEIRSQMPTTDTYSLPQTQEEFYFALPYDKMDICLYGKNLGLSPEETGKISMLTADQIGRVYADIDAKRRMAEYLHAAPFAMVDDL